MLHLRLIAPPNISDAVVALLTADARVTNLVVLPGPRASLRATRSAATSPGRGPMT